MQISYFDCVVTFRTLTTLLKNYIMHFKLHLMVRNIYNSKMNEINGCFNLNTLTSLMGRNSAVDKATGYLDGRGVGVRVTVRSRILSSPQCSDRLWGPPSVLFNGYLG
jgi:hypothetical protein